MNISKRMQNVKASEIRELLKLTAKPSFISFGGGLPSAELFPIEALANIAYEVIKQHGQQALQYSTTEGHLPLREHITKYLYKKDGLNVNTQQLQIVSGSQQGLDLLAKLFLDEGDVVFCENPSYLGALSAFNAYGVKYCSIETNKDGMVPEALEHALKSSQNGKIIYVIPDFQNPTGRTWSQARREAVYRLAVKYNKIIIEDNPYGELRYEGQKLKPIKSLDEQGLVIYLGTFSKVLCPGYRVAWVCADEPIINQINLLKQGTDLHTSTIDQMQISAFLDQYDLNEHVQKLITTYKKRRDCMLSAIQTYFPKTVMVEKPSGGLFLWMEFADGTDTTQLLERCIKKEVAFVPGKAFYANEPRTNTCRLNYSNMPEERIIEGIKRISQEI